MRKQTTPPAPSPEQLEALATVLRQQKATRRTERQMAVLYVIVGIVALMLAIGWPR